MKAKTELERSGDIQISFTDRDCRLIKERHRIEPAYRMHAVTNSKHSLIVDYEVTNDAADNNHLASMTHRTKEALGVERLNVCADAGYDDSVDLKECEDDGITTYVPVPKPKISKKTNVPTPAYYYDKFVYCPQGQSLRYFTTKQFWSA